MTHHSGISTSPASFIIIYLKPGIIAAKLLSVLIQSFSLSFPILWELTDKIKDARMIQTNSVLSFQFMQ